jgi:hypothetical protein
LPRHFERTVTSCCGSISRFGSIDDSARHTHQARRQIAKAYAPPFSGFDLL